MDSVTRMEKNTQLELAIYGFNQHKYYVLKRKRTRNSNECKHVSKPIFLNYMN